MGVQQKLITAEELEEMVGEPGKRFELVDGEVIEVPGANDLHMTIMVLLFDIIRDYVRQHDLGLVRPDGLSYVLRRNRDVVRIPDVSFVSWKSVPEGEPSKRFWEGPPALAVEIVSPSDRATDLQRRVQDYLHAGTQLVWVLWPETRSVTVHALDGDVRQLGPEAQLDGGDVLPGFSVQVGDLFDIPQRQR